MITPAHQFWTESDANDFRDCLVNDGTISRRQDLVPWYDVNLKMWFLEWTGSDTLYEYYK